MPTALAPGPERMSLGKNHRSLRTDFCLHQIRQFSLHWWNVFDINSGERKEVAGSPHRQRVLQPSTDLSVVRQYETGDLGLVPRANEHLCTQVDTMRWLSSSLNYQMVGRIITRSVATQTPESLSQPRRQPWHYWTVSSNSSHSSLETSFSFS